MGEVPRPWPGDRLSGLACFVTCFNSFLTLLYVVGLFRGWWSDEYGSESLPPDVMSAVVCLVFAYPLVALLALCMALTRFRFKAKEWKIALFSITFPVLAFVIKQGIVVLIFRLSQ